MIIVLRSTDLTPDPRVAKFTSFFDINKIPYLCMGWNRQGKPTNNVNKIFFEKSANFSDGNKNILNLILWNFFILKRLLQLRKQISVIHACDFDTILPAVFFSLFFKCKLIFDVFDWYSDSRNINNKVLKKIIVWLEIQSVKKSDYVIICEEQRLCQIPKLGHKKVKVMQNIPTFNNNFFKVNRINDSNCIKLSYVGILGYDRGLEDLIDVVSKNRKILLTLAGFGSLESMIRSASDLHENIIFYGQVEHEKAMKLMSDSNAIIGMYYKKNRNHILAAPNKYYESLALGRPLITTKGTLVGSKVEKHLTGFAIDEGKQYLNSLFAKALNKENLLEYSKNCRKLYESTYKNRIDHFLNTEYLEMIK